MTEERMLRRYTEKEVGALIQRASEIQEEATDEPERGLSLQELESIASELGIAPEHLRAAAAELSHGSTTGKRFWGGPFALQEKRFVEASITDAQWGPIVEGLRRITGSEGRTDQIGRSLEWTRERKDLDFLVERTAVTIRPGDERASIEVRKYHGGAAAIAYGLGVILGGGIAGVFLDGAGLSDLVNGLIVAGGSAGGLGAARSAVGYLTRRQRADLKRISDWLYNSLSQPEGLGEPEAVTSPKAGSGILLDTDPT